MNKNKLTALLSVMCVLLCAMVLFCACSGDSATTDTTATTDTEETAAATGENATTADTAPAETETETVAETVPETEAGPTLLTYTISVVDADGNPVEGVEVQMCSADGTCYLPVKTGANGLADFQKAEGEYYVTIPSCPAGYTIDSNKKHTFEGTSTEMTITLEKAAA